MPGIDLDLSKAEVSFQAEAREWLRANVPEQPLEHHDTADGFEEHRRWEQKLFRGGWSVPGWPRVFGGREATLFEVLLFEEEYARAGAPDRVNQNGLAMLGPTLMALGNRAQKDRFLRPLAAGEEIWAQAWSEPGAGSDLASLTTRAIRDGDEYILRGQKTWVSRGSFADWYFALVRVDPQTKDHHGLTFLLVPRRTEGVTTRAIEEMDGRSGFAEVFFDGARVPIGNAVGADGEGWRVAMATLGFERSAFLRPPGRFTAVAERLLALGRRKGYDVGVRRDLADAWASTEAYRFLNLWNAGRDRGSEVSPVHANVNKLAWSEMDIRLQELALRLLGPAAELWEGAPGAEDGGRWARDYLFSLAGTIYAGTSEIQRNLIAERGLGLPRG
jgi:alkylation response protein AidB-like acyl-CoA dehydrogenase